MHRFTTRRWTINLGVLRFALGLTRAGLRMTQNKEGERKRYLPVAFPSRVAVAGVNVCILRPRSYFFEMILLSAVVGGDEVSKFILYSLMSLRTESPTKHGKDAPTPVFLLA